MNGMGRYLLAVLSRTRVVIPECRCRESRGVRCSRFPIKTLGNDGIVSFRGIPNAAPTGVTFTAILPFLCLMVPTVAVKPVLSPVTHRRQDQVKPLTKELLNNKVPNFYCFEYKAQPQPGKRYWLRVSDVAWIERYPDGYESKFRVLGHGVVKDMQGTIVFQVSGSPAKTDTHGDGGLLAFIPDKGNAQMHHWYRNNERGDTDWHDLGPMLSVE